MPDTMITTASTEASAVSLKTLLRNYRKTFKEWKVALKGDYDRDMTKQESTAYQNTAAAPCWAAIDAMIEAPVVSHEDIATKLGFLFEVVADGDAGVDPNSWEGRILKNILRDIRAAQTPSLLPRLLREFFAADKASDAATERWENERARVRQLHPPAPHNVQWEFEGKQCQRPVTDWDFPQLIEQGELAEADVETWRRDLSEWETQCEAIDVQHLDRSIKRAADETAARLEDIDNRFRNAPATSLADAKAKLDYFFHFKDVDDPRARAVVCGLRNEFGRIARSAKIG
jgi:hypothetical protein